jgi:hypothetical protein
MSVSIPSARSTNAKTALYLESSAVTSVRLAISMTGQIGVSSILHVELADARLAIQM